MEKSSFFNSVNGDRKYKAEDFAEFFNSFITNGVFPNPSTNLHVTANNNMTVTLKSGKAWINGHVYINTDDLVLTIDVADGVLNRIDRLVLRLDTVNREIKAQVKKGTFASSPVSPTLQRDADGFELGIADIYISKGVVSIVQANITDLRMNTGLCGWVNSLIQADTTAIFNQYLNWYQATTGKYEQDINTIKTQFQQEFDTWFTTIKDTLSGDIAGNLLNKINDLSTGLSTANTNITNVTNNLSTHLADYVHQIGYATATGSANTYSITLNPAPASLVDGLCVAVKINTQNTGASTINVNGLGAKSIKKTNGNDVVSGNLKVGSIYTLRYNGTNFQLLGEGGEYGTVLPNDVRNTKTFGTENGVVPGALDLSNLTSENIRSDITIDGITGTLIERAKVNAGDIEGYNLSTSYFSTNYQYDYSQYSTKIKCSCHGIIRIKFSLKSSSYDAKAYGKIFKNGVAVGISRSTTSTTDVIFTEDIPVIENDLICIGIKASEGYEARSSFVSASIDYQLFSQI